MLTKEQLAKRKNALGSSDMAAILGLSPYKTAYDVYLEKTGKLEDAGSDDTPLAAEAGNFFESSVLDWGEQRHLGMLVRDPIKLEIRHETLPIVSHPDALVRETGEPVEAKTAGLFTPLSPEWGDPGTDNVPTGYVIQAHVHILVTKASQCHMPAFLGGRGFELFTVKANPDLLEIIAVKAGEFWTKNVQGDTPPDDVLPSLDIVKKVRRIPGKVVSIPELSIQDWLDFKAKAKEVDAQLEEKQLVLLTLLGDAEGSEPTGLGQLTYFMQGRTTVDGERLKTELPDIYARYLKTSKFRVLRLKKAK